MPIVAEGGTILIVAGCEEGIGSPEFQELLLNTPSADEFAKRLDDPNFFVIDQWQLQELCKVLSKADIMMYSEGIAEEYRDRVLVKMVPTVEVGLEQALQKYGADARVAVVPKGPYVLTRVQGEN